MENKQSLKKSIKLEGNCGPSRDRLEGGPPHHVYTNVSQHISSRGILTCEILDHLPTFCSLTSKPILKQEKVLIRDMNKFDKTKFLDDVYSLTQELNDTYNDDFNPNNAINQLLDKFSNLINQHAPLRPQTRKEIKLSTKP